MIIYTRTNIFESNAQVLVNTVGVIYQILKDKILIVAIANLHRKPNYWKDYSLPLSSMGVYIKVN